MRVERANGVVRVTDQLTAHYRAGPYRENFNAFCVCIRSIHIAKGLLSSSVVFSNTCRKIVNLSNIEIAVKTSPRGPA